MTTAAGQKTGWAVSLALHALLAGAFLLWVFDLRPFVLDFTPVSFAPAGAPQPGGSAALPSLTGAGPLIELPRRPMLEESSPLLKLPESVRRPAEAPQTAQKPDLTPSRELEGRRPETLTAERASERRRADIPPLPLGEEVLQSQRRDILGEQIAGEELFSISWEGSARVKLSGVLPRFPEGVNRAATVRIAFEVAPDGTVAFLSPQTKGLPAFEKAAMEALRGWRFNPLDRSQPQLKQKGVVTFRFTLK